MEMAEAKTVAVTSDFNREVFIEHPCAKVQHGRMTMPQHRAANRLRSVFTRGYWAGAATRQARRRCAAVAKNRWIENARLRVSLIALCLL